MKRILFLIVPVIAALCAFSFVKQLINNEITTNLIAKEPPPEVMCYDMVEINTKEAEIADLKDQLEKVEKLYADKKIDDATYKVRKEGLKIQIEAYE